MGSVAPRGTRQGDDSHTEVTNRFLNRDLQWLEFNNRVLHMSGDANTPLLERVRFLSIFSSNLDEFFMKRVGGLKRRIDAGAGATIGETDAPAVLLKKIRARVEALLEWQMSCLQNEIIPELRENGIEIVSWDDLDREEQQIAEDWHHRNVLLDHHVL